jgi:hypothetical protein
MVRRDVLRIDAERLDRVDRSAQGGLAGRAYALEQARSLG